MIDHQKIAKKLVENGCAMFPFYDFDLANLTAEIRIEPHCGNYQVDIYSALGTFQYMEKDKFPDCEYFDLLMFHIGIIQLHYEQLKKRRDKNAYSIVVKTKDKEMIIGMKDFHQAAEFVKMLESNSSAKKIAKITIIRLCAW
jgi:hypothetical protein